MKQISENRNQMSDFINKIHCGDCIKIMPYIPDNSVDSIVADPPAGISFMGKEWDTFDKSMSGKAGEEGRNDLKVKKNFDILPRYGNADLLGFQNFICAVSVEAIRVLKPGGHALVWAIPRTSHHTAMGLERAGFEIRDCVYHIFGSGFPKSLDISKQIDKKPNMLLTGKMRDKLNQYKIKAGFTTKQINEYFGFATTGSGVAHHWFTHPTQPTIPTQEQYQKLKKLLNIRDESLNELYIEAEREIINIDKNWGKKGNVPISGYGEWNVTIPKTDLAKQFQGWGTALKPAVECWWLCRKPLSEKTVALNVLKWGVGGINVDRCRVGINPEVDDSRLGGKGDWSSDKTAKNVYGGGYAGKRIGSSVLGRFPANLIHDGSDEVLRLFPNSGKGNGGNPYNYAGKEYNNKDTSMFNGDKPQAPSNFNDSGSAARFFYCAKASRTERDAGCEDRTLQAKCEIDKMGGSKCTMKTGSGNERNVAYKNNHPTVKPIALMRYLIRLITPRGGIVLDPFIGSGTTAIACKQEGFRFIGIEKDTEYCKIAEARIRAVHKQEVLF